MVFGGKSFFGYDDSLDAFGVHGAGGTLGAILTGFFAASVINPIYGKDAAGNNIPTGAIDGIVVVRALGVAPGALSVTPLKVVTV